MAVALDLQIYYRVMRAIHPGARRVVCMTLERSTVRTILNWSLVLEK
jgi:hypothetical protein